MPRKSSAFVRHDAVPRARVVGAAKAWAGRLRREHPEIVRIGFFGSYARDDYVPGSDFDVLIEVTTSDQPRRNDRPAAYQPDDFPIGMEVFVYTTDELTRMRNEDAAFIKTIDREITWLG